MMTNVVCQRRTVTHESFEKRLGAEGNADSGPAKKAKAVGGGAVKKAPEKAMIAESASLPKPKRKEKRKAAQMESQAEDHTSEEEVSDERRARKKKKKAAKAMPHVIEGAEEAEEEEEDLEPLLA
ncbi:hypothetical protein Taro_035999 [Colocasia esculenta]|uniref:Uncharacterized protein n=1 Tax=Colocasia esculenta TaxID=4460 RepID=A0A843VW49_COLES|nr:hypothetical protein [Colocasia esculenta]